MVLSHNDLFINLIDRIIFQKWYVEVTLIINAEFQIITVALLNSGADINCIQKGIRWKSWLNCLLGKE
jgi:hypothetical protein